MYGSTFFVTTLPAATMAASPIVTVTFPTEFTNNCLNVSLTLGADYANPPNLVSKSKTSFVAKQYDAQLCYWFAIGN